MVWNSYPYSDAPSKVKVKFIPFVDNTSEIFIAPIPAIALLTYSVCTWRDWGGTASCLGTVFAPSNSGYYRHFGGLWIIHPKAVADGG